MMTETTTELATPKTDLPISKTDGEIAVEALSTTRTGARNGRLALFISGLSLFTALSQPFWQPVFYPVPLSTNIVDENPLSSHVLTRLEKIESALAALQAAPPLLTVNAEDDAKLKSQIEILTAEVASLQARLQNTDDVSKEIASLKQQLETVTKKIGNSEQQVLIEKIFVSSVLQITSLWQAGQPFASAWSTLLSAAEPLGEDLSTQLTDAAPILLPWQDKGLPSLSALNAHYQALLNPLLSAQKSEEAARESWFAQMLARLKALVVIRRTGEAIPAEEQSLEASLVRAGDLMQKGDLAGAIDAIATLSQSQTEPLSAWLQMARARVRADVLSAQLSAKVAALVAPSSSSGEQAP